MAPKIKRLAILFLGLWLVIAGLTEQLAEAAAGRTSPGYSKPSSSPTNNVWGSRSGGGSYGYSRPAAPSPGGYAKPPARRLYQAGAPPPAVIPSRQPPGPGGYARPGVPGSGGYTRPATGQTGPRPPPTPNRMGSRLRPLRGVMPNRGKARLR